MGKRGPQPKAQGELMFWEGLWYWVFHHLRPAVAPSDEKLALDMEVREHLKSELEELNKLVPADEAEEYRLGFQKNELELNLKRKDQDSEPAIWRMLVAATKAADVRKACKDSKRWLNPEWHGRPYVQDLYDGAEEFVHAKINNPYYPRRDSGDATRVTFFARAMAGISLGLSPNTAIDRLRKVKHGRKCPCVHCDLKRWDRIHQFMGTASGGTQQRTTQTHRRKMKSRR